MPSSYSPFFQVKTLLQVTVILLATIFCPSGYPGEAKWGNKCQLSEHQDDNRKLTSSSPYTYYLCTSINTESVESYSFTIIPEQVEPDTVIAVPGSTPLPEGLNVVALGNPESNEYAMIEDSTAHVPQDVLVAVALQAQEFAGACGNPGFHAYRFKTADQAVLERIHAFTDKELRKQLPLEFSEDFKKKIPLAGPFARHWPDIIKAAQSIANYIVLSLPVVTFGSLLWDKPIKNSVARFEPDPENDFTNCPVRVLVDTNELLGDMHRQNITVKQFTSLNTIREISEGFNSGVTTFQTTGRFIDFLDNSCQCAACPGESLPQPARFSDCLVDVIIQTDVMVFDALRLTNSNFNDVLNAEVPLSGYIAKFNGSAPLAKTTVFRFSINSNTTLNTAIVLYANFSHFDTPLGLDHATCSCPACPPVQTSSSLNTGAALVGLTNLAISIASGVTIWVTVLLTRKVYARIKA